VGNRVPDIFLSYNREDQAVARLFAEAFEREGFTVWWDVTLRSGEEYDKVTEDALNAAKAVVVLWSPKAVESRWVRAEATQAQRNGTLVPAMIAACKRPIMFELTQTAELAHWRGDPRDKAWAAFLVDVKRMVAKDAPVAPLPDLAPPPAAKSVRRPLVIGAAGLAGLAIVVTAGVVLWPRAEAVDGAVLQRTAFFGFTVDGDDPTAAAIAKSATDETFATLNALGLPTVPGSETENIQRSAQLTRAREFGARYALGGEVRRDRDQFSVIIRLDDVEARTTLLQDTVTGGEAQKVSLPVQAAARATSAAGCYINIRNGLSVETDEILRAMKLVCAATASGASFVETAERWRELARLAPNSAGVQAARGLWLFLAIGYLPSTYHPAMRQEIDETLKHTLAADPANFAARLVQADLSVVDGGSLADAETHYRAIQDEDPNFFFLNMRYGMFLAMVGRNRDAVTYLRTGERLNPLNAGMRLTLALALANSGQPREAEKMFRHNDLRLPDYGENWSVWIQVALFDGAGEPREVLTRAPPGVSPDALACLEQIVEGVLSADKRERTAAADRLIACEVQGSLFATVYAIRPAAALGRLDEAFAFARKGINPKSYNLSNAVVLFTGTTRPMRADPRFLPFVKELGLYQYWLDTKTHPDVCDLPEEMDFEVCVALRAAKDGDPSNN
jgi:tetratricopeptide (TPR) repeat protein/TolB-like protein